MCTCIYVYKYTHICKYIAGEKCDFCSLWLFSCLLLLLMSDRTVTLQTMRISYLKKLKVHTSSTSGRMLFWWLPFFWPPQKWGQSWCDGIKRTQAFMWATQGWLSTSSGKESSKMLRLLQSCNPRSSAVLHPQVRRARRWASGQMESHWFCQLPAATHLAAQLPASKDPLM